MVVSTGATDPAATPTPSLAALSPAAPDAASFVPPVSDGFPFSAGAPLAFPDVVLPPLGLLVLSRAAFATPLVGERSNGCNSNVARAKRSSFSFVEVDISLKPGGGRIDAEPLAFWRHKKGEETRKIVRRVHSLLEHSYILTQTPLFSFIPILYFPIGY